MQLFMPGKQFCYNGIGLPPRTVHQWRTLVNAALPLNKLSYMGRNCPKKFDEIWLAWVREGQLTLE